MKTRLLLVAIWLLANSSLAGTLRLAHEMGYRGAESLDPISPTRFVLANQMIYDRLIGRDSHGALEPHLATHWQSNHDGSEWTLDLRQNVTFHDGRPFTAADVVYTFKRITDPSTKSAVASVLGFIDHINILSSHRIRITLKTPHTDLPALLTDYRVRIVPKQNATSTPVEGVGTGPFVLERLDAEGVTLLKANRSYWKGIPGVDAMELVAIRDFNSRLQALLAGQIDWLESVSARQKPLFEKHQKLWTQSFPTGEWRAIVFRTDMPPFDDVRVRQAVRIAVDRNTIMHLVSGKEGGLISCDTPVWPGDDYRASLDCERDLKRARVLLTEAGYSDGLSFDLYTSDLEPEFNPMAEAFQQQVRDVGIKVTIRQVPADSYWQSTWKKVPAMLTRWSQRPADQVLNEVFRGGALWNDSGFHYASFDQALDQARRETDFSRRQDIYQQLQQQLFDTSGTFIPYHISQVRVLSSRVEYFAGVEFFSIPWDEIKVK